MWIDRFLGWEMSGKIYEGGFSDVLTGAVQKGLVGRKNSIHWLLVFGIAFAMS